jgi:hypothetical protein
VEACVAGYPGDAEDYFNDLTARDGLERALREPTLQRFPEIVEFRASVHLIDARFRPILRGDAFLGAQESEWWNRGVVRYAGPRLVAELREVYGVKVDTVRQGP